MHHSSVCRTAGCQTSPVPVLGGGGALLPDHWEPACHCVCVPHGHWDVLQELYELIVAKRACAAHCPSEQFPRCWPAHEKAANLYTEFVLMPPPKILSFMLLCGGGCCLVQVMGARGFKAGTRMLLYCTHLGLMCLMIPETHNTRQLSMHVHQPTTELRDPQTACVTEQTENGTTVCSSAAKHYCSREHPPREGVGLTKASASAKSRQKLKHCAATNKAATGPLRCIAELSLKLPFTSSTPESTAGVVLSAAH